MGVSLVELMLAALRNTPGVYFSNILSCFRCFMFWRIRMLVRVGESLLRLTYSRRFLNSANYVQHGMIRGSSLMNSLFAELQFVSELVSNECNGVYVYLDDFRRTILGFDRVEILLAGKSEIWWVEHFLEWKTIECVDWSTVFSCLA